MGDNLDALKDTLLRQANAIFSEEEIKFSIFEADSKVLKYANLFIKEDTKKEKKKKEKVQVQIAEEELLLKECKDINEAFTKDREIFITNLEIIDKNLRGTII